MTILTLAAMLFSFQSPLPGPAPQEPPPVWEEIAKLEDTIKQTVRENRTFFSISSNDPVQGYYIDRVGVMLMIPVRYRPAGDTLVSPSDVRAKAFNEPRKDEAKPKVSRIEIQKKLEAFQEKLKESQLLKEANFEKVVDNLKNLVPELIGKLSSLPSDERLVMIIEERVPSWYYAGFSLKKNATRKVVTLTVDKDLISKIHANKTELPSDWTQRIKRSTTNRKLITNMFSGKTPMVE